MTWRGSHLPDAIRCPVNPCGWTLASHGDGYDDDTVADLRMNGWAVINGAWTCPRHVPPGKHSTTNGYCSNCRSMLGGPYGHEDRECTWTPPA